MGSLGKMGFLSKWRSWTYICIFAVCNSVLVNDDWAFSSSGGLLQGGPLFPLLFILVMEKLSRLVIKAINEGILEGFQITKARSEC